MLSRILALIIFCLISSNTLADDSSFYSSLLTTVQQKHLTPVNLEEFTVSGLKGFFSQYKNLTFSNGSDMVYIYLQNQQIAMLRKPENSQDIDAWADIAAKISQKISKLNKQKSSFITEQIAFFSVQSLQDHSRYIFSNETNSLPPSDIYYNLLDEKILYIKISNFNDDNASALRAALKKHSGIEGIIIDLRGNQGGQINDAISIAKLFIDDGIILSTKGKNFDSEKYYVSDTKSAISKPLAILIDGSTASSAEILAAALKEQAQAVLIGTTSFGKGSYQETYIFENGGKLTLTVGEFYTPSGKNIDHKGLSPDYCIINNQLFAQSPCPKQNRENQLFDIEFALKKLK